MYRISFLLGTALLFLVSMAPNQASATPAPINSDRICSLDRDGNLEVRCTPLPPVCGDQTTVITRTNATALRLDSGVKARTPVDVHGFCRYLDSSSADDYFVPFKKADEWEAFRKHTPAGVDDALCARQTSTLYFGRTSKGTEGPDKGDPSILAVNLPYARVNTTWPTAACGKEKHTFNYNCDEQVSNYHCYRMQSKTCYRPTCVSAKYITPNGKCLKYRQEAYDCSYCADSGSKCGWKNHKWSEIFNFHATAYDSDYKVSGWKKDYSNRIGGVVRPKACKIRCTYDGHDCRCSGPTPPIVKPPIVKPPTKPPAGSVDCAYGFSNGQVKTESCPCGRNNGPTPKKWGFKVWNMRIFGTHLDGCMGSVKASCFNGKLSLISARCRASSTGKK